MTNSIIIYFSLLLSLFLLPERFWESFLGFFDRLWGIFINEKKRFLLMNERKRGEKILEIFPIIESQLTTGLKALDREIADYKFYGKLLARLLDIQRKMGISLKQILPEIRVNLVRELEFDKKMDDGIMGANFQFITIGLTTWGFIFFSRQMLTVELSYSLYFWILFLQCSGFFLFNFALKKLKEKTFKHFGFLTESLYLLIGLSGVGLSISYVLKESGILQLNEKTKEAKFTAFHQRLFQLVERWKQLGSSPAVEASEISVEVWNLKAYSFTRFLKLVEGLKFTFLAIFFMPAYFLYIYQLFQSVLRE